ncbi:hypothetical protein [Roseomonas mucosa]|uniref:hypothetical protein n=1 Tax=Roseomonas mucosa TaxID=207340 RepID=UPI00111596D2|nr:hypothetical protein [Roseomonas mucosa]
MKLGQALFFKHNGRRLDGKMWCRRFDPLSRETDFAELLSLTPVVATLKRGQADLSSQFSYAYNYSPDDGAFHAVITMGEQYGLTVTAVDFPLAERLAPFPVDPDYVTPQG